MCGLLRFTRKKLSYLIRKWFVYISVMGVMGTNSNRILEHLSVWKPWRLAKQMLAHWMMH